MVSVAELQEQAQTFHSRLIQVDMVSSTELQEQAEVLHSRSMDVNIVNPTSEGFWVAFGGRMEDGAWGVWVGHASDHLERIPFNSNSIKLPILPTQPPTTPT